MVSSIVLGLPRVGNVLDGFTVVLEVVTDRAPFHLYAQRCVELKIEDPEGHAIVRGHASVGCSIAWRLAEWREDFAIVVESPGGLAGSVLPTVTVVATDYLVLPGRTSRGAGVWSGPRELTSRKCISPRAGKSPTRCSSRSGEAGMIRGMLI